MIVNELTRILLNIPEDIYRIVETKYLEELKRSPIHKSVVLVEVLEQFANEDLVYFLILMEDSCTLNTSLVRRCVGRWLTDMWILSTIHKGHFRLV
jgi:hypothetical protein